MNAIKEHNRGALLWILLAAGLALSAACQSLEAPTQTPLATVEVASPIPPTDTALPPTSTNTAIPATSTATQPPDTNTPTQPPDTSTATRPPDTDTPIPISPTATDAPASPTPSTPFIIVRLAPEQGQLSDLLAAEVQTAQALGLKPVVEFDASW